MMTLSRGPQPKSVLAVWRKPYLGESAGERRVLEILSTRRAEFEKKLQRSAGKR